MDALVQLDSNILLWIQDFFRQDFMNWFWIGLSKLGDNGIFWIAVSLALLCFKKTRTVGIVALCSIAFCFLVANIGLKNIIQRPRPYTMLPDLTVLVPLETEFSFPSGHTTASFAVACIYFRMLPKKYGIAALVLAALIGLSRLYVGVHYPTDVLGGLIVGVVGSTIVYHVYLLIERKRKSAAAN